MDEKVISNRLLEIARHRGSGRDPFIVCDRMDQDKLFAIQEKLMSLIDELDRGAAVKALPFMYRRVQK